MLDISARLWQKLAMNYLSKHYIILLGAIFMLSACNVQRTTFEDTLTKKDKEKYGIGQTKIGQNEKALFAGDKDKAGRDNTSILAGGDLQINRYLWTASLDVASFLPLSQIDAVGGVILTDWHALPEKPNERYKANIIITGTALRADALNISLFKQRNNGGNWQDTAIADETTQQFKDSILTRAREIRFFSIGSNQ